MKDFEKAAKTYKKGVRLSPKHYTARFNLACAYFELQKYEEALDQLRILERGENAWGAHYDRLYDMFSVVFDKVLRREIESKAPSEQIQRIKKTAIRYNQLTIENSDQGNKKSAAYAQNAKNRLSEIEKLGV